MIQKCNSKGLLSRPRKEVEDEGLPRLGTSTIEENFTTLETKLLTKDISRPILDAMP
jgi:hypothetical protein